MENSILEKIKEKMQSLMETSKGILIKNKSLEPTAWFLYLYNNEILTIPIPGASSFFESPFMKNLLAGYIKHVYKISKKLNIAKGELVAVVLISETFMIVRAEKEDMKIAPSECPDRKEAIMVLGSMLETDCTMITEFKKVNDEFEFQERKESFMHGEGRFNKLFPAERIFSVN